MVEGCNFPFYLAHDFKRGVLALGERRIAKAAGGGGGMFRYDVV